MATITTTAAIQELDHRENNGIAVSLLWNRDTNTVAVRVYDSAHEEEFELDCAPAEALDVFRHPYAYAATRPVKYSFPVALV